jgi:hypothetical protein
MIKISRLRKLNILTKVSRLRKIAEWSEINMSDPDLFQKITDAITYGYPVQINYEGSGWRNIQPYGWNTSKQKSDGEGGNVLLMCYKDTGELRSYRLDKIQDLYIDYDNQVSTTNNPQMADDEQTQIYEDIMNDQKDIDMPTLPEDNNEKAKPPGVYDDELSILRNEPEQVVQTPNNLDTVQQPQTPEEPQVENTQQEVSEEPQKQQTNIDKPNNEEEVSQEQPNEEEQPAENNEEEENKNE